MFADTAVDTVRKPAEGTQRTLTAILAPHIVN